jgi:hypothetical protein
MDVTLRPRHDRPKRSPLTLAVSIALHLVAGAVLLRVVTLGIDASRLGEIKRKTADPLRQERLQYVRVSPSAPATPARPAPAAASAQGGPVARGPRALVAPPAIPQGVPAAPSADTGSTAAGAGGDGSAAPMERGAPAAARGVTPGFVDRRLWGVPDPDGVPRSGSERIDSVIVATLRAARDSADSAALVRRRAPGDWTRTTADGQKWGWDQTGIRLGKVTLPNALLGLLPLNAQRGMMGNPIERERNARVALMRDEIQRYSTQAVGEDQFRQAVKALRARRDRERAERLRLAAEARARGESPSLPQPAADR